MILFITGPSGAGKSTLATAWVASRQKEIALIDADHITSWMRNGETSAVGVAFAEGPVERIAEQYQITAEVYAAAARAYDANGVDVVIAQLCGFDPPHPWSKGWDLLEPLEPIFVVLYPERDVCHARLTARGGVLDMSSYDFDWSAWKAHPRSLFLDNSHLSVDESVTALNNLLESSGDQSGTEPHPTIHSDESKMSLVLETERLKMRAFQDRDIQIFAEYRSDPDVARYQDWDAPYSVERATKFIARNKVIRPGTPGEWHQIAIERKDRGDLIGDCVFHILAEDDQQAEIGFTLSRQHQGQGYATEAVTRLVNYLFGELQLHRIRAICDVENLASSRLLERIGMRREAHFVENIWFKGQWGSEYEYGLLRREWAKSST